MSQVKTSQGSDKVTFDDVVKRVSSVLGRAGHAVEIVPVGSSEDEKTIRVVASGGAGGLNPVVVTARVLKADEDSSEVWLRAAAKEGLIRQRAGEKTAVRLAAQLSKATGADRAGPHPHLRQGRGLRARGKGQGS
jgi:predicted secreted protein